MEENETGMHKKILLFQGKGEGCTPVHDYPVLGGSLQAGGVLRAEQPFRVALTDDGSHPEVTLAVQAIHVLRVGVQPGFIDRTWSPKETESARQVECFERAFSL